MAGVLWISTDPRLFYPTTRLGRKKRVCGSSSSTNRQHGKGTRPPPPAPNPVLASATKSSSEIAESASRLLCAGRWMRGLEWSGWVGGGKSEENGRERIVSASAPLDRAPPLGCAECGAVRWWDSTLSVHCTYRYSSELPRQRTSKDKQRRACARLRARRHWRGRRNAADAAGAADADAAFVLSAMCTHAQPPRNTASNRRSAGTRAPSPGVPAHTPCSAPAGRQAGRHRPSITHTPTHASPPHIHIHTHRHRPSPSPASHGDTHDTRHAHTREHTEACQVAALAAPRLCTQVHFATPSRTGTCR